MAEECRFDAARRNGMEATMLSDKGRAYTDLLVREICAHLEWMAATSSRDAGETDAFYKAARSIGRNRGEFVIRTMRQMEWHGMRPRASRKEAKRGS